MGVCFHCGEFTTKAIEHKNKLFCCYGCKTVFDIIDENDLSYYYELDLNPGTTPTLFEGKFDFLRNKSIANKLLEFNEQSVQIVSFNIPSIHCSSCIWVLENLNRLNKKIIFSQVNFPKKTVRITFSSDEIELHEVVFLLCKIGYEPNISLDDTAEKDIEIDRSLIYKLGVAGFAFG
ncbi:MAG: heavy metal translocating P-type ATPase, partial [Flavobacteriaceae bacterium]|nr:heavy metal translocating P-type ATPase [Flavobacteriaceae bacterium]